MQKQLATAVAVQQQQAAALGNLQVKNGSLTLNRVLSVL
jgi:hypothetical protein